MQTLGLDGQDASRDSRRGALKEELLQELKDDIRSIVIDFLKVNEMAVEGIVSSDTLENEEQACTASLIGAYLKYKKAFKDYGLEGVMDRNALIRENIREYTDDPNVFVDEKVKVMLERLELRIANTAETNEF